MDIRKRVLFFHFFVFFPSLICHHHLATKFETFSTVATSSIAATSTTETLDICSGILGKLWKNDANKTLHENIKTFNVCVPKKQAFHEFVDVNEQNELKGGFSIAIFCLALQELPFKIQPLFKPIKNENYTQIVQKLEGKDCDAVAGDVTITSNRARYAYFTTPYMSSEIYILVRATRKWNQTILTLLKPFTIRLWLEIILACILIGVAIGYLENRGENPSFCDAPFYKKLKMIVWYPVSKIFLQEGEIKNRYSKVVRVIWLTTIFIVMQIFTACLSSWLTLNQLQAKVPKQYNKVGYQNGSFVVDFVNDHVKNFANKGKALALSCMDDYKNALKDGTVDAIFDELPYIDIFLAKYGDNYMKVGPIVDEAGLAFAFPLESPLRQNFSNAVVKVIESQDMMDMKKKYLGITSPLTSQPDDNSNDPQSLDDHSFYLLFLFMGIAIVATIIFSEIPLRRRRTGTLRSSKRQKSEEVIDVEKESEWAEKAHEAIRMMTEERKLAHHDLLTVQAEKIAAIDKHSTLKKEISSYKKEIIGLNQEILDLKAETEANVEKAIQYTIEDAKHSTLIIVLQCRIQMAEQAEKEGVNIWKSSLEDWRKQLLEIEEKDALEGLEMVAMVEDREEVSAEVAVEKEKAGMENPKVGDEGRDT